ncbi:MAG: DUF3192 domain-containing protein [Thalassotalea sp.]
MIQKFFFKAFIILASYCLLVLLVVNFYDDNPSSMKWEDREEFNRQFINQLKIDRFDFEQAMSKLGKPDISEEKYDGPLYFQVVFYRTQHMKSDGYTTQDECTYLFFVNGILKEYAIASQYKGLDQLIAQYQQKISRYRLMSH